MFRMPKIIILFFASLKSSSVGNPVMMRIHTRARGSGELNLKKNGAIWRILSVPKYHFMNNKSTVIKIIRNNFFQYQSR